MHGNICYVIYEANDKRLDCFPQIDLYVILLYCKDSDMKVDITLFLRQTFKN